MENNGALLWNIRKIVSKGDYLYVVIPEHPNKTKNNYVLLHRVIVENNIGRLLSKDEIIHHKDENKRNNEISNLEIMSASKHARLHGSSKGITLCDLKCPWCGKVFTLKKNKTHIGKNRGSYTCCSKSCRGKLSREIQLERETQQMKDAISVNILKTYHKKDNTEGTHLQETP